ncbi:MAG: hypothetical protein Q9219_006122 [cf. Caloplaca sp. 3 TL-2023]
MPSYAILGATGATGSNILKLLAKDPQNTINVYVRSKPKLLAQVPDITSNKRIHIFAGNLSDSALMTSCLKNTDAVFSTVASNDNVPGTHVAQDTAQSIVVALMDLRMTEPQAKIPTIIWLSSASVNPTFYEKEPALLHWLLTTAFSYVYTDLSHAERYLKLHQKWMKAVFIQPGGLVEDRQHGHALSLDKEKTFLSYADLAAGMIEVAEKGGFDWQGVSVIPTTDDTAFEWKVPGRLILGVTFHFAPWMYWLAKTLRLQ